MNDLLVTRYLSITFKTVNDLNTHDFENFKYKFIQKHRECLDDTSFFDRMGMVYGHKLYYWLRGIHPMYGKTTRFTHTRVKLGKRKIMIPVEIDIMMELIFSKDLNKRGLFRRSGAVDKVSKVEKTLFKGIKDERARENIIKSLKYCDIIILTIVFKKLFDGYLLLFPEYFLPRISEIINSTNSSMEAKLIKTKFVILCLPSTNRYLLDSICQFFSCIHFISTDKGTDYTENMNIRGFAVVMAPKLFVKTRENMTMEILNDAITFLDFIFVNSKKIFCVDKGIL